MSYKTFEGLYAKLNSERLIYIKSLQNNSEREKIKLDTKIDDLNQDHKMWDKFYKELSDSNEAGIELTTEEKAKYKERKAVFPDALEILEEEDVEKREAFFNGKSDPEQKAFVENVKNYETKRKQFEQVRSFRNSTDSSELSPDVVLANEKYFNFPADQKDLANHIYNNFTANTIIDDLNKIKENKEKVSKINKLAEKVELKNLDSDNYEEVNGVNKLKTDISSTNLDEILKTTEDTYEKHRGFSSGSFVIPVGLGETKETSPDTFKKESDNYNSPYMASAKSIRASQKQTWQTRYGKFAGWNDEKNKRPNLLWKWHKPSQSAFGDNPLTNLFDAGLSIGFNVINSGTFFQMRKWYAEFENRADALDGFAKKYMPTNYSIFLGSDASTLENRTLGIVPRKISKLLRVKKFYTSKKDGFKDKISSIDEFNKLAIRIQEAHAGKLDSKEAQRDFKTLAFIGRKFTGSSNIRGWLGRQLGHTLLGRALEGKKAKMQRRSIQFAQGKGNYLKHMKEAVGVATDLTKFLNAKNSTLLNHYKYKKIARAVKKLNEAKAKNPSHDHFELQDNVFNAIQKANLRGKRNHSFAKGVVAEIKKLSNEKEQEVALKKLNFLVSGCSKPRVEINNVFQMLFHQRYKKRIQEKEDVKLERIYNGGLLKGKDEEAKLKNILDLIKNKAQFKNYVKSSRVPKWLPNGIKKRLEKTWLGAKTIDFPDYKKLNSKSKRKLRNYIKTIHEKEKGFEKVLKRDAIKVETQKVGKENRQMISLDKNLSRQLSYLYNTVLDRIPSNAIDLEDKNHVEKQTNRIIKDLKSFDYKKLESEFNNNESLPFYIGLKKMEAVVKAVQNAGKLQPELKGKYEKDFAKAEERTEHIEKLLNSVKEYKGKTGNIYTDGEGDFAEKYEDELRELQNLFSLYNNYGVEEEFGDVEQAGKYKKLKEQFEEQVDGFDKTIESTNTYDELKKINDLLSQYENAFKEISNHLPEQLNDLKSQLAPKLEELEKNHKVEAKKKAIKEKQKAEEEKKIAEEKIAEEKKIEKKKEEDKQKAKEKKEKPIEDLNLKILELQASKETTQEKERSIALLNNEAMSILKTYQKAGEKTPDEVTELFTKILQIEIKINQEKILEKLTQKDEFGKDNDGSMG